MKSFDDLWVELAAKVAADDPASGTVAAVRSGVHEVGKKVVLGWSDTRESARAGHDMLAVLKEHASVTILRVGNVKYDAMRDSDGIGLAETLSRHGLDISLETRTADNGSIAEVLGKVAFEQGADMIVTGALGHSRVYDFVLGATTHALLENAKIPVLFSKGLNGAVGFAAGLGGLPWAPLFKRSCDVPDVGDLDRRGHAHQRSYRPGRAVLTHLQ